MVPSVIAYPGNKQVFKPPTPSQVKIQEGPEVAADQEMQEESKVKQEEKNKLSEEERV